MFEKLNFCISAAQEGKRSQNQIGGFNHKWVPELKKQLI